MFTKLLDRSETYTWPVDARIPISGGGNRVIKFEVEFIRVTDTRAKEMTGMSGDGSSRPSTDEELLAEVLVNVRARDDAGQMRELPDEVKAELLDIAGVKRSIALAFFAATAGAKAKN